MTLRIIPVDQGVCPLGHPCRTVHDAPGFRQCDETHDRPSPGPYMGTALVDVYAGPVGEEAYAEACAALNALIAQHEAAEHPDHPDGCPGAEVCSTTAAFALRAIQDVLDPLPRDPDRLTCDVCGGAENAADLTPDWNGETGAHRSCEASR